MTRIISIFAMLSVLTLASAAAFAETEDEFAAKARAWLLANPEVLVEAMQALEAKQAEATAAIDGQQATAEQTALFHNAMDGFVGQGDDVVGVEFFDYQCGYCKRQLSVVEAFIKLNPDKKIILKEFPILGPGSELAARTALATRVLAGNDAYVAVHKALMEHKGQINTTAIDQVLQVAGVDPIEVRARMTAPDITAQINNTRALAQRLGINGTPGFAFRDSIARGLLSLEELSKRGN